MTHVQSLQTQTPAKKTGQLPCGVSRVRCDEGLGGLPYVDAYRLTLTLQFQRARFHEAQIESGGLICGLADEHFAGPGP